MKVKVRDWARRDGTTKEKKFFLLAPSADLGFLIDERFERERNGGDPKDGDLCLSRLKPGEILVEGRRGSDVQIDLQTRV